MDVIGTYLESALRQNELLIFMRVFQSKQLRQNILICKIQKNLYSFKQAESLWNKTVIKFFWKLGFNTTNKDFCILILVYKKDIIIIKVYVKDLLLGSRNYIALK